MIKTKSQRLVSMDTNAIIGSYKTTALTYYDGNIRNSSYTDIEAVFTGDEKVSLCTTKYKQLLAKEAAQRIA